MSRTQYERLRIRVGGVDVWVAVVEVNPYGKVRLGISAPRDVEVMREELIPREPEETKG